MKLGTKLLLGILGAAAFVVLVYQSYLFIHYRSYSGYKQFMDQERGTFYEEGSRFSPLQGGGNVPGMELVASNEYLELYTDVGSTNVALYDKRTGIITYACPPDADDDPLASPLNKSILKSPITVEFFNARRAAGRFNAFDHAIQFGSNQVAVESIGNGVRYIYTLGDLQIVTGIVPLYLYRHRLDAILERVEDDRERQRLANRYMESEEHGGDIWELREGARGAANIRQILEVLNEAGYTEEEFIRDSMETGVEGAVVVSFEVAVEYRLDGDSLLVSVPTSRIVENAGAMIDKIHLTRFFNSGETHDEGYMLVPNGSGSLVYFNNEKTGAAEYAQLIYGQDRITNDFVVLGNFETARMPVFGTYKENGQSTFAQIEEGQAFAQVSASVSGRATSYNSVWCTFIVRGNNPMAMFGATGAESDIPVVEANMYQANLTVRYSFLTDEYEGYSGMAGYYRERLVREGVIGGRLEAGDIPLYMDLIGAARGTKFMLSVQYQGIIPMTTYSQAGEIVDLFNSAGITNQVVNYQGWFNRGYYHDVANRINPVRQLGSKKEFEDLSGKLEAQGGKLYADVIFQNVPFSSRRYNWQMENSRYYAGGMRGRWSEQTCICCYQVFSIGYRERWQALVSPKFLPRHVAAFTSRIGKYDVTGISLRDLGDFLHSDRNRNEFIDREHARSIVEAQLDIIAATGKDIMVSGGNAYALGVADDLIDVPLLHSGFVIVDEEVPFYQMVIHGHIPYAGYAINRSDRLELEEMLLKMIEYGASPRITLTYEEASEMKHTGLNHYFGTHYLNWTDTVIDAYNIVNPVLSRVRGSAMLRHDILPDGLRSVIYDNGVQILVNYTDEALFYEGIRVDAKGFAVREGVAA